MISAELYLTVYLTAVTILTFICCTTRPSKNLSKFLANIVCIAVILFIGLRPLSGKYFVDMGNYNEVYSIVEWNGFEYDTENLLFDNLLAYMAGAEIDITLFFLLMAFIYFSGMLIACYKWFPNNVLLAFLVCLAAFSTFSYGTNGIKAGAAASIFLVALAYRDKLLIAIPLALISWGFHHSMQLPVAAYIISILFKKISWYYVFWVTCLILSIGHITLFQTIFSGWTDEKGAGYLSQIDADFVQHQGFRADFVFYSIFPLIMGYYAVYEYNFKDKLYQVLLRTYTLTNAIWLLCMYAPYTNRIAYLSWFMYPILIIYPCMKKEGKNWALVSKQNLVVGLHLGFTLFMNIFYY